MEEIKIKISYLSHFQEENEIINDNAAGRMGGGGRGRGEIEAHL